MAGVFFVNDIYYHLKGQVLIMKLLGTVLIHREGGGR